MQSIKSETYNKQFFICLACNEYLCPICNSKYNKEHKIIDYNYKNFICNIHIELYKSYYGNIMPNKDIIEEEIKDFRKKIDKINEIKSIEKNKSIHRDVL